MSQALSDQLDALIRDLARTNWISGDQLDELRKIAEKIRALRPQSDRVRVAVFTLVDSTQILKNGRWLTSPGRGRDLSSSISELHRAVDEIRPLQANEKRRSP